MHLPVPARLARAVNPVHRLDGRPFDPATPFGPPHGRYRTVHYGVMVPDLPAPLRFMDVIAIIGQPKLAIWRNEHLIKTTARDTVSLLTATGGMTAGQLTGYSLAADCDFAADGSRLRFGEDFLLEGVYPNFHVRREHPEVRFDLRLTATDKVTQFAKFRGGAYDHWSLLCEYAGTFAHDGVETSVDGLCTLEYARGTSLRLPFRFFTYHILNIGDRTQVLMGQVLGPRGLSLQGEVSVRSLDEYSRTYRRGFHFTVHSYEDEPRATPEGRQMLLPAEFSWHVEDDDGTELIRIDGRANGDYTYGMAAGFAGSYQYTGTFRGQPVSGPGYLEYIDGR